jgi:hypothetical protein
MFALHRAIYTHGPGLKTQPLYNLALNMDFSTMYKKKFHFFVFLKTLARNKKKYLYIFFMHFLNKIHEKRIQITLTCFFYLF